ncbi:MAG TPA: hypothetical protein VNO21_25010, partial [Polyangiaceae bacterium]|nr:hypothetical protein [Polyangiaceae bacterium]
MGDHDVLTQHNDVNRAGATLHETILNTSNVRASSFGRIGTTPPTDGLVFAQPLYAGAVTMAGRSRNILYVADMTNVVYAFDADTLELLQRQFLGAPQDVGDVQDGSRPDARNVISSTIGVLSTPVLDRATNTMFVVGKRGVDVHARFHLFALDMQTLAIRTSVSVCRSNDAADTNVCNEKGNPFDPDVQLNRPGLLYSHGTVYAAFGSNEDKGDYHGWVVAYASDGFSFSPQGAYSTTQRNGGGIWQAGNGVAAADDGDVYFMTGNGIWDKQVPPGTEPRDEEGSFVRLRAQGGSLVRVGSRYPSNTASLFNNMELNDADLGSGGVLLIPGTTKLIGGGKTGVLYTFDRNFTGRASLELGQEGFHAFFNEWDDPGHTAAGYDTNLVKAPHIHGSPVFWVAPTGEGRVYAWSEKDRLKAFAVNMATGAVDRQPQSAPPNAIVSSYKSMPGGILSLSANGSTAGTGIVWASIEDPWCAGGREECNAENLRTRGRLIAFDAETLRTLWQSEANTLAKFAPPTVANGRVYLSTFDHKIVVYGLNGQQRPTYPTDTLWQSAFDDSKCVGTANNGSMVNGTELVIWDCSGNPDQRWRITEQGFIKNSISGKCIGT